jgi:hypothetical protein
LLVNLGGASRKKIDATLAMSFDVADLPAAAPLVELRSTRIAGNPGHPIVRKD